MLCHPNIGIRIEMCLCHHLNFWFLHRSSWGGTCPRPWSDTDLSFAALAIPALVRGTTKGGHTLMLGRKKMEYLFQVRVSLVSKQKEFSTINAAKKAKFFCNSIIAYSRSFKIQRVLQLFTLFGKENEQICITDVIGLRGKVNKRCCF